MGYTTEFEGEFEITPPLDEAQVAYLNKLRETRRMMRHAGKTAKRPDPVREAVGLPVGEHGAYFVGETGFGGQDNGPDVLDQNRPPPSQPGLWNHWEVSDCGCFLYWDGGEKFYYYTGWLRYIVEHFLAPWGRNLNGKVEWAGEEPGDLGKIVADANVIRELRGTIVVYE